MALANGLTVAGVLLLLITLAALPGGTYWLPDALTGISSTSAGSWRI